MMELLDLVRIVIVVAEEIALPGFIHDYVLYTMMELLDLLCE